MRIFKMIGISVASVSLAFVTACGGSDSAAPARPATTPASPPPSAKETLATAVKGVTDAPYTYTMKLTGVTVTGAVDPAGTRQAKLEGAANNVKYTIEGLTIGADQYFKTSIPATGINAKKWYKLDHSKITKNTMVGLFDEKDPTNSQNFLTAVVTATRSGPTTITGTYDLTKGGDLGIADSAAIAALGDKVKSAPFEVTLTDSKVLAAVKITVPAYGSTAEQPLTVDYAKQGEPLAVTPPKAADLLAAPAAVYKLLNG